MFARKVPVLIAVAALLALPAHMMAAPPGKGEGKTTTTVPVNKGPVTGASLISQYTELAGSPENATSLVNGLRNGAEITLNGVILVPGQAGPMAPPPPPRPGFAPPPPPPPGPKPVPVTVTFTPPTGTLGWGSVDVVLAFTQAQFTELQIAKPNPNELKAALMGGEVQYGNPKMTRTLPGILQLRASGMGWGQIAKQLGYTLQ